MPWKLFISVLLISSSSFALPKFESIDLSTSLMADEYAKALVAEVKSSGMGTAEAPLIIVHIGHTIPKNLNWLLTHLKLAGFHVKMEWIESAKDVTQEYMKSLDHAHKMLSFENTLNVPESMAVKNLPSLQEMDSQFGPTQRMGLQLKRFFEIPHGVTLIFKIKRTEEDRVQSKRLGKVQGGLAALSIGAVYYTAGLAEVANTPSLLQGTSQYLHAITTLGASTALYLWVYLNIYQYKVINELLFQGKTIDVAADGTVIIKRGNAFTFLSNFARGFVTNALIMGGVYTFFSVGAPFFESGTEYVEFINNKYFTSAYAGRLLSNAFINMFARSKIDNWIQEKTPIESESGVSMMHEGQFSEKKARHVRNIWEFSYGFAKNLHMVKLGAVADYLYLGLAAFNISWIMWDKVKKTKVARKLQPSISKKLAVVSQRFQQAKQQSQRLLVKQKFHPVVYRVNRDGKVDIDKADSIVDIFAVQPSLSLSCSSVFM